MKIDRHNLKSALEIVKPGLANKEIIEQSRSFAFLGDRVLTYNDEISISHPIDNLDLNGSIRAEELYGFLSKSTNKDLQLKITENELLLKSGRAKAGLSFEAKVTLPLDEINDEKDWKELPVEFTHDLMAAKDNASRDMSQQLLTYVHVTDTTIESSDGFQIKRVFTEGWPFNSYLIPADTVADIHKIEPNQVAETDGWLHFRNGDGTELSVRILMDKYPTIAPHFEVEGEEVTFPKNMNAILERAMEFTKRDHELDEEMEIKLLKNKIKVSGRNEYAWFEEIAKVDFTGNSAAFWIRPALLKDILTKSNECILGKEKLFFSGEGWEYVAVLKQNQE